MRNFRICTAAFIILIVAAGFWARSGYTQIDWNNDEELSNFTVICCNSDDFEIISADDETSSEDSANNDFAGENVSDSTDSEIEVTGVDSNGTDSEIEVISIDSNGNQIIEMTVLANDGEEDETDTEDLRKELEDALRDADYVLKVSCDGNTDVSYGMTIQDVTVLETYAGLKSLDGKSIQLVSSSSRINIDEICTIGGHTNLMKKGEEYLLFCNDIGSKNMYREVSSLSYFALSDLDNIIPESDETAYELLKNNEFFAADQEALDILLDIKENMLDLYLQ